MGEDKKPERFSNLGPPGMARRFGMVPSYDVALKRAIADAMAEGTGFVKVTSDSVVHVPTKDVIAKPDKPKGKRGRPKATGQKPWEAEGISRALWYRRKKGK